MNELLHLKSGRSALTVAFAALVPLTAGNLLAASDSSYPGKGGARVERDAVSIEEGTIPAARPIPPQSPLGVEGRIRSDTPNRPGADPSIRDTNPLTVNGLWVTLPGNRVVRPGEE
jgi:hypothetical protein